MEFFNGRNVMYVVIGLIVLMLDVWVSNPLLLNLQLVLCSVFLICLVLIQRGRGGGLAGAFGGMGGSSAFGTKAGDVFTWTTVFTAIVWFVLSMALVVKYQHRQGRSAYNPEGAGTSSREVPLTDGGSLPKAGDAGTSKPTSDSPPAPAAAKPETPAPAPASGLPPALEDESSKAAPAKPEPAKAP